MELSPLMELPILPLRTMVLFPHAALPMTLSRRAASQAVAAAGLDGLVAVVTQAHDVELPGGGDLFAVGTGAVVRQLSEGGDTTMVILEGLERIAIVDIVQTRPFLKARVRRLASEKLPRDPSTELVRAGLLASFDELVRGSTILPIELGVVARSIADDSALADMIASALVETAPALRQDILATLNVRRRMEKLQELIGSQLDVLGLHAKLPPKQIELRAKLEKVPSEPRDEALRELDRLDEMPPGSPETPVIKAYVEWIAELPWEHTTSVEPDLAHARSVLDADHFGMQPVKDRILELLAVQRLKHTQRGPLICLVGPPGVGKTSIGRSIARATGRQLVRVSLGGIADEAEIRGHRRTYVGAMPGQIIRGLKRGGSRDPVFMLDEIDKLGRDHRGDPASALLEVLDPEQNHAFRDHYLDVSFDLSAVMFIATANVLDTVPEPLRDRMEIIELSGYLDEDKLQIARRYLVAKQVAEAGIPSLPFTDGALLSLIRGYTHEAGVRKLEQLIANICRKRARQLAEGDTHLLLIDELAVATLLGPPKFHIESQVAERTARPGVAVGVAWTAAGGDVLFVECSKLPHGRGDVTLTGQMGDVMQESARTAVTWVRAHAARYGIPEDELKHHDLHIHVPAGAVPKDGPSAGVVMVAALVSLLTGRPVNPLVAMTGELTLSGHVLPVGGLEEKLLAARRSGIRRLIVPAGNAGELAAIDRGGVELDLVSTVEEALERVLPAYGCHDIAQHVG